MYLEYFFDEAIRTIGPSPKVSDNTTLCNTEDMPADSEGKAVDIYLINILVRNNYY
jgi:hypothetical protein